MMTGATLYSGGGGADIGMHDAGIDVRWGIEYDGAIAEVARNNDLPTRTADVTEVDPQALESVDCLHASPPCPSFSIAKTGAKETEHDIELARCTATIIRAVQPRFFTLENVWKYRQSVSWAHIRENLNGMGYEWNAWHLNAADYGVPQTRKRMIVAAVQGGPRPSRPQPTHSKPEAINTTDLFGFTPRPWVGWYESIADLVPDLETTELAPWQKKRLPDELKETTIVNTNCSGDDGASVRCREKGAPTFTVKPPDNGRLRAVLIDGQNTNPTASGKREDRTLAMRESNAPANTVNANQHKGVGRAVLVPGGNASSFSVRDSDEPSRTVGDTRRVGNIPRAITTRRVLQLTPRCLARFQTFPDWYELPERKALACRIIGNAVPPLLMQRLYESLT